MLDLLKEYKELSDLQTPNIYQRARILEISQIYVSIMGCPISFIVK